MDSNTKTDFPSNYNKLLFESICIKDDKDVLIKDVLNNNNISIADIIEKSEIYQKQTQSFLSKNNYPDKNLHNKNIYSINKNEINTYLSNNKEIDKNKNVLNISISSNKFDHGLNIKDNNKKIYKDIREIGHKNAINNNLSYNNNNKEYNDNKDLQNDTLKNENDKREKLENNTEQKRCKKTKMEPSSNDIDIEFPIIRNTDYPITNNINNDNNDSPKIKHLKKEKLMKQIEIFNSKLLNNKEMDKFLEKSKQLNKDTNELSILDKVILDDISKKIINKNANDISNNELTDANGTTNNSNNNNNKNLRGGQSSNNNNFNFNGNFNQFNRNVNKSFSNFGDNDNHKNNEDNNSNNSNNTNEESEANNSKSKVTNKEIRKIRCALRRATVDCSERGLFQAAKW